MPPRWKWTCRAASTIALALLLASPATAAPAGASPSDPPNIVLLIGDDVGWMDFGFMGSEAVHTPHLDALAKSGTVFTHAFAPDSVCQPVLQSLLTGLSPQTVAARLRAARRPRRPSPPFADTVATLPAKLAEQGYASFQGGKFWEGGFVDGGFTHGMTLRRKAGDERPTGLEAMSGGVGGRELGRKTMEPLWSFLEAHGEGRFFIWYAPMLPHVPFDAPEEFAARYAKDPAVVRGYRANLTRFDATVGQLLGRLSALGVRERTLIVYVSDNGWDARPGTRAMGLGGPRGKGTIHELGVRTPLVLSLPGVVAAGARDDRLVSLLDVAPTLLAFAGAQFEAAEGRSLHPLLTGTGEFHRAAIIGGGGTKGRRNRFLRTAAWRYTSHEDLSEGLYLIEQDPYEEQNLAARQPELLRAMRAELIQRLAVAR